MDGSLESFFTFYVFTTGRRLFALRQVRVAAKAEGFTELVQHCDAAIAHDRATRELERRWATEPTTIGKNPAAQRIDVLVDRTLGAIRDHAIAQTEGADPDDSVHAEVAAFVKRLFPIDVRAVTTLPYIDELAAVDDILKLLKGELAATAAELGLGRLTKRLAGLAVKYREALEQAPPSMLTWGKVRAARAEGQGMLLEAVAIILGRHHGRSPEATAARLVLLGPILRHNEAIGQYLKKRRSVVDVDPETGEDASEGPGGESGPEGGPSVG